MTAQSLNGFWGGKAKRFSEILLDEGLVHVFASDAHDVERRPPILDEAYADIKDRYGEHAAKAMFVENPRAVIEGRKLPVIRVEPEEKARPWYRFW